MKVTHNERAILWLMGISTLPFLFLLSTVDYSLVREDPQLFQATFLSVLANVLGFIAALFFFWQILIGTRHFTKYLTLDTVWVNKLHRTIGTYGILFVLSHPLLEAYAYLKSVPWLFTFDFSTELETFISLGRLALYCFLVIWITSAILRKKMKFRPWKYIHYLSYPLMGFVFFHALEIGTFLQTYPWIRAFWFAILLAYIAIVIIRIAIGGGLGKRIYKVINIEHVSDSIILLHLSPSSAAIAKPDVGQYAYLQTSRFHEAHPFTVMDIDPETNELIFGIKTLGKFTRKLGNFSIGSTLLVDGPYGTFTREGRADEKKIVIAGGIGVTPFVRFAKEYGKGMTFIHCNRTEKDIVRRDDLLSAAERYFDIIEHPDASERPYVIKGRLTPELLEQIIHSDRLMHTPVFICGSPMFIGIMKKILSEAGVPKSHLYSEELGFL